jgi:flagellar basal body-associated protein FliL
MRSQKGFTPILLIVIIAIVLVAGVSVTVIAFNQLKPVNKAKNQPQVTTTNKPQKTATASAAVTTLKTY